MGLTVFLITADGETTENPRYYRRAEKQLAKAQRRLSRRKKRSKRWYKAARQLAKQHQKVRRQRGDFHHKTALALVRAYDTIYLEDLQIRTMVRNRRLRKSIGDAGWGQFRGILEAKAAYAGRQVVAVPGVRVTFLRSSLAAISASRAGAVAARRLWLFAWCYSTRGRRKVRCWSYRCAKVGHKRLRDSMAPVHCPFDWNNLTRTRVFSLA